MGCGKGQGTRGLSEMNKAEFIAQVAKRSGTTKKDAEKMVEAVFGTLSDLLVQGDKVNLPGFGAFETRTRSARTCRNIHTGEPIAVAEARVPVFKPAKTLKERVDQSCVWTNS